MNRLFGRHEPPVEITPPPVKSVDEILASRRYLPEPRLTQKVELEVELPHAPEKVWAILVDTDSHPHWLDPNSSTQYESEAVGEGTWFKRIHNTSGRHTCGQIMVFKPASCLVVRAHTDEWAIMQIEYHLEKISSGCKLRVVWIYDAGYFYGQEINHHCKVPCLCLVKPTLTTTASVLIPEPVAKQHWEVCLSRLRDYCDRTLASA